MFLLYAKFHGQKKFKALDLATGVQVNNLIHATLIPSENLGKVEQIIAENMGVQFKIKKAF